MTHGNNVEALVMRNITHIFLGFDCLGHTFHNNALNVELLINEHKVSGKKNKYALEICYITWYVGQQ